MRVGVVAGRVGEWGALGGEEGGGVGVAGVGACDAVVGVESA